MNFLIILNDEVTAVCPIEGISIGRAGDKSTWKITFASGATDEQKRAAQQVVDNFDTSAVQQRMVRRERYAAIARLKTVKAEAVAENDTAVADDIQREIDRLKQS